MVKAWDVDADTVTAIWISLV